MNSSTIMDFGGAQEFLGISRSTLLRWIRDGRVSGYKAGRKWKFYRTDLERLLLKEPQAVYSTGSFSILLEELQELGLAEALLEGKKLEDSFWCEWQDRDGWLWLSCSACPDGYELYLQPADFNDTPGSWPLSPTAAHQLIQAWQIWSSTSTEQPPRPGRVRCMRGTAGGEDVSLYLTRHTESFSSFEKWFSNTNSYLRCRELMNEFPQDWLITGPPYSTTAYAAYALAQRIVECNPGRLERISTCETDHTCFLPGAIHMYPEQSYEPDGVDACLIQLASCSEYPARGMRSPRVRICYAFTESPGEIDIPSVYHLHVYSDGKACYLGLV